MTKAGLKEGYAFSHDQKTDSHRLSFTINGEVVGYIDAQVYVNAFDMVDYYISKVDYQNMVGEDKPFVMIKVLHVDKKHRNNGIAGKLLGSIKKFIEESPSFTVCENIMVEVAPLESSVNTLEALVGFYKKNGYRTIGHSGNIYLMITNIK